MWTGAGEWIWRPLCNPAKLRFNMFVDNNPRGFGLLQRDRNFDHYQDDGVFYEKRPCLWVEPKGDWGEGSVQLVEIPTVDQLGNARPATPSVGAVEYSSLSGITGNVKDVVRIWNSGNIVYATGLDKAATAKVYSMTGGLVYEGIIANHSALELPIEEGVYLIVVDKAIQKLIIK